MERVCLGEWCNNVFEPPHHARAYQRILATTNNKYKNILFHCSILGCNGTEIQMHHENYKKPLKVKAYCKVHHIELHNQIRAGG